MQSDNQYLKSEKNSKNIGYEIVTRTYKFNQGNCFSCWIWNSVFKLIVFVESANKIRIADYNFLHKLENFSI